MDTSKLLRIKKEEIIESDQNDAMETCQISEVPEVETKYCPGISSSDSAPKGKSKKKTSKRSLAPCTNIESSVNAKEIASATVKRQKTGSGKHVADNFGSDVSATISKPPKKRRKRDDEEPAVYDTAPTETTPATSTDRSEATDLEPFQVLDVKIENKLETAAHSDLVEIVIDEICLEGLDGITTEALWTRIADRTSEPLPLRKHIQKLIWDIARSVDRIHFYELPEPRAKLVIFNRYKYFDWETGYVVEPEQYPEEIYPFVPISDKSVNTPTTITNNILGSCGTFESRKDITEEVKKMHLKEAEIKFGSTLVMVADQPLRTRALISEYADPTIKLSNVQYCILERIGRSRKLGEVTAGQNSLLHCGDSKTLFYLRKQLVKNNFITKQPFVLRNKVSGNSIGLLFHLKRFYTERKSKKQVLIEQVVDILKKKPNYRMEYVELKRIVGLDTWSKGGLQKLLKTPDFRQFVNTDVTVPYRTLYPNALPKEWKLKSSSKEKGLRVLELINPSVSVAAVFREEEQKDESSDDEPIGDYPLNISIFNHSYSLIFESGPDGISLKQLQKKLGLEFYLARSILNNMVKRNMVDTINVDVGRQHIIRYYARCFNNPEFCAKYNKEKENDGSPESTQEYHEEEEALDFIADVLKVDKQYLSPENALAFPEEVPVRDCPFSGEYEFIKMFRKHNRLEKYNMAEKYRYKAESLSQLALRDDMMQTEEPEVIPNKFARKDSSDKEKYEGILRNLHLYYPMDLSLKEKRIEHIDLEMPEPTSTFSEICKTVLKEKKEDSRCLTFESQYAVDEGKGFRADLSFFKFTPKTKELRLLGHTENVAIILQEYFFKDTSTNYSSLLTTFKNVLQEIITRAQSKDLVFPPELQSDDEYDDDVENSDKWSVLVNIGDTQVSQQLSKITNMKDVEDFKRTLIEDFEKPDFLIRREILEQNVYCVTGESPVSEKRPFVLENQLSRGIKVVDTNTLLERQETDTTTSKLIAKERLIKMNTFMGPNPVISSQTVDEDGIMTSIIISTTPEKYAEVGTKYKNRQMSQRSLARANFIIDTVYRERMISDLSKLTSMLKNVEKQSNFSGTIDKKTLDRLLHQLVVHGFIKMVKIVLKYGNLIRSKNMICLPPVDVNTVVQSSIEQMKMGFFIYAKRKTIENLKLAENKPEGEPKPVEKFGEVMQAEKDFTESLDEMDALLKLSNKPSKFRYSRIIGRQYGYVPKFAKIKILHEFLFYLIYSYDGEALNNDDVPNLLMQLNIKSGSSTVDQLTPIYKRELSWRMFIPPLPKHKSWPNGWALVCDILLRLPLSVFVKIYNISYIIPDLFPFLEDPLRRHFLIKSVPDNIRNAFLCSRKYIFSIHELMCHLCYMGLLQFGAQKLRDKDQQFIYLNKRAVLYDTVTSQPGYHEITRKDYEKLSFTFHSISDLEEYWSKMWSISMSTKLGQRYSQLDKTITLQHIHAKQPMMEAMLPKTPQTAADADVGYLPGDHLGACCLDSSTWAHVKRNWVWSNSLKRNLKSDLIPGLVATGLRKKHLDQVKVKPIKYRDLQKEIAKKKMSKREGGVPQETAKKAAIRKKIVCRRKLPIYRKVLPRPPMKRKKIMSVDDVDTSIMNKMGKSRSIWSDEEDITLLLCKSSANFLCPNIKKKMVPYTTIRDVMHRLCPNKRKKPSTAYTRRYHKLVRSDNVEGKQRYVYDLDSDKIVQKYFSKFRKKVSEENCVTDEQLCVAYAYLASYAVDSHKRSYKSQQKRLQEVGYIDYLTPEDMHKYNELSSKSTDILYQDACNEDDITVDLVKSIIHSSLSWKTDSSDLPLTLYRIYQNYPENLLRSAIVCLREQQIITGKKAHTKHINVKEVMNVGGSLIHSSFTYLFKQITKYPDYVFHEAHQFFMGIHKYKNLRRKFLIENFEQGHGLGLSEMATNCVLDFTFKIPDEVLVLDPNITDHSELFQELAVRYKLLLSKRNVQENSEDKDQDVHARESDEQLEKMIETIFDVYKFKMNWKSSSTDQTQNISDFTKAANESQPNQNCANETLKGGAATMIHEDLQTENVNTVKKLETLKGESSSEGNEEQVITDKMPTSSRMKPVSEDLEAITSKGGAATMIHEDLQTENVNTVKKLETLKGESSSEGNEEQVITDKMSTSSRVKSVSEDLEAITSKGGAATMIHKDLQTENVNTVKKLDTLKGESSSEGNEEQVITDKMSTSSRVRSVSEDLAGEKVESRQTSDKSEKHVSVSDLAYLLTKGLFPELDDDEERLEKLHRHFLLTSPSSTFSFLTLTDEEDWYQEILYEYLPRSVKLFKRIQSECVIRSTAPEEDQIFETLKAYGANVIDLNTAKSVIAFTRDKGKFGATSQELKDKFPNEYGNFDLSTLIILLVKTSIIIRVGICNFRFVHYDYNFTWTVYLDEQRAIAENNAATLGMRIKLMPWMFINGTVNTKVLINWLGIIISHCMSFPFVTLMSLSVRFNFLKPVDIFFLLECLHELSCIQLYTFQQAENVTLFSSPSYIDKRPVTVLDDFDTIFVETDTMAATKFGAFWNRGKEDVKTPFDV